MILKKISAEPSDTLRFIWVLSGFSSLGCSESDMMCYEKTNCHP